MKTHFPHEHGNNLEPPHFWTHPNHHAIIVEIPIDGETNIIVGFTAPFKAGTFQGVVLSRGHVLPPRTTLPWRAIRRSSSALQNAQDHPGDKLDAGIIRWYIITIITGTGWFYRWNNAQFDVVPLAFSDCCFLLLWRSTPPLYRWVGAGRT